MAAETKRERAAAVIRTLREQDAAAVAEILRGAPESVFWPESSVKEVVTSQSAVALLSEVEGRAIGFLIGRQAADEAEILNLAVVKESRRKGEGGALLEAALEEFRARAVSRVFLEVRDSNAAGLAFYAKHGFSKIGRREGYYREPFESAIVMEKKFTG
ncbi:MAG TPA: ribosomal protein S18-alanine N-acetyltransferase [Candidatus Dormibacteraeota bacterium]|nr:ribosomal protein S18-alanine N-acetyltransferase [Candidatus Dormibacteraeota bacterium]